MNSKDFFKKISSQEKNACFLYSKTKSVIAINPVATYKGDNLLEFKKFQKKHSKKLLIGYFSYDLAYQIHNIKAHTKDDLKLPKILFYAFDKWLEFQNGKADLKNFDKNIYQKISNRPQKKSTPYKTAKNFTPTIKRKDYDNAYQKIENYIKEGDIYQINLTHRLEAQSDINSRDLFLKILEKNDVDFPVYIEDEDFQILSASPERFIKIHGTTIETCPIKGTRPRGKTKTEDQKFQKQLIESEKEAAELNMITDLLRNDIGKISKTATVKVQGHRLLSKCPTVWHTYSRITGEIKTTPVEALISMLPGGSITGCPKKRAIEIIDELESHSRGIYTGNIGYISPNGDLDFNIAIRTVIKKNDKLYLQVGGGSVLDSTSKSEYKETLDKAASFMDIL